MKEIGNLTISNSQVDKWADCPTKWKFHYIDRIRSVYKPSSLFFGSAMDEALGRMKLSKKKPESFTEEERKLMEFTVEEVFLNTLRRQEHNGEEIDLKFSPLTSYFKSDFDLSLLTDEDFQEVSDFATENDLEISVDEIELFMEECFAILKKGQLSGVELLTYNLIGWLSLYRKGLILIDGYEKDIMSQIKEVFDIQKKVELPDGCGNTYIGYIDYTAIFLDEPETYYVCDDKTSSRAYPEDSVQTSTQLASYCEFEKTNKAAYSVVEKKIRKRNPRYRTQLIRDEIPEEQFVLTFQRINDTIDGIEDSLRSGEFPKAKYREGGEKNCYFYGRKCEYYGMPECHGVPKTELSDIGLVKLEDKTEESNNG